MLKRVHHWIRRATLRDSQPSRTVCFCTLAIHEPYRRRARTLCADLARTPFVVLTDEPGDFADLPIRAIRHSPTGPMAIDYLARPQLTPGTAQAYHDKRFVVRAALEEFDTAIFVDADSRIRALPRLRPLPPGVAVRPGPPETVARHLQQWGPKRLPAFVDLARHLTGDTNILANAKWCCETCYAVTRDGRESSFFEVWDQAVDFMQSRGVYTGEGGVMGLAAACAGWAVDYHALAKLARAVRHEGGGPKRM